MTGLAEWAEANLPEARMFWQRPAVRQFEDFQTLETEFGPVSVVGTHTSKSINLPVVEVTCPSGSFLLRDNFHSVDVCALWSFAPVLAFEQVYGAPEDWDWYGEVIAKAGKNMFPGWTDEEIEDPRILRVRAPSLSGSLYWEEITGLKKDRWARRWESTRWFEKDWSSGRLLVRGEMGSKAEFFRARHAFAEGINRVLVVRERADNYAWEALMALKPWEPGKQRFTLSFANLAGATELMRLVCGAGSEE